MKPTILSLVALLLLLLGNLGCKKFIQIDTPKDKVAASVVFETEESATAAVRGIYARMRLSMGFASGSLYSVTFLAGRSADDFINQTTSLHTVTEFSLNTLQPNNPDLRTGLWQEMYKYIYSANAIIEGLNASTSLQESTINQLMGEALFFRGFCHFYLCNLFGPVPLITSTDYRINNVAPAAPVEKVYAQIERDLLIAQEKLNDSYPTGERVRVNKSAVTAFLARVYLYQEKWELAENAASDVITKSSIYKITSLDSAFLKNSEEAILQLMPTQNFLINTNEAREFVLTEAPGPFTAVTLSSELLNAFESEDQRLAKWVGSFSNGTDTWQFPYKYKIESGQNVVEYSMILRVAEQYLIRAEARIQQAGKIAQGLADLNVLRKRARPDATVTFPNPLPDYPLDLSKPDALLAVEKERRLELFSEWGHRWLDLKRTGRADAVLAPIKGANWESTDVLYPIPESELLNNTSLNQNEGYER